jgi:ribose 5-phosphate isomerase A
MSDADRLAAIGERSVRDIQDGMIVGLGTGSTAEALIHALGTRVAEGLKVTGVTTSERTSTLAASRGIALTSIDEVDMIDICIDGADEIDPELNVVKGRGGALLWEKLTARRARHYLIIASSEKRVERLGTRLPLPVEIVPYGWMHTAQGLETLGLAPTLRLDGDGRPFVTDGHHYIVDCGTGGIPDPHGLAVSLKGMTGVVEHGLFVGMADEVLTIEPDGTIQESHRQR